MVLFDGFVGLLFLGVWIFCIIDVITTPNGQARNLPKIAWLLIVILLVDIGSLAWLLAGRPWGEKVERLTPQPGRRPAPNRVPPAARRPTSPDDDEEFLASLRARAEEQRRRARDAHDGQPPDEPAGPGS